MHTCQNLKGAWVLSSWTAAMLREKGLSAVSPVPPHFIEHDEVVGISALQLRRKGVCNGWLSERELKMRGMEQFQIEKNKVSIKYPDAIFQMTIKGKQSFIALEYERTGKSSARYRSLIKNYCKLGALDLILYVTENDEVENRIRKVLEVSRFGNITNKIAFVKGRHWRTDPLSAPFQIRQETNCLAKLAA